MSQALALVARNCPLSLKMNDIQLLWTNHCQYEHALRQWTDKGQFLRRPTTAGFLYLHLSCSSFTLSVLWQNKRKEKVSVADNSISNQRGIPDIVIKHTKHTASNCFLRFRKTFSRLYVDFKMKLRAISVPKWQCFCAQTETIKIKWFTESGVEETDCLSCTNPRPETLFGTPLRWTVLNAGLHLWKDPPKNDLNRQTC